MPFLWKPQLYTVVASKLEKQLTPKFEWLTTSTRFWPREHAARDCACRERQFKGFVTCWQLVTIYDRILREPGNVHCTSANTLATVMVNHMVIGSWVAYRTLLPCTFPTFSPLAVAWIRHGLAVLNNTGAAGYVQLLIWTLTQTGAAERNARWQKWAWNTVKRCRL